MTARKAEERQKLEEHLSSSELVQVLEDFGRRLREVEGRSAQGDKVRSRETRLGPLQGDKVMPRQTGRPLTLKRAFHGMIRSVTVVSDGSAVSSDHDSFPHLSPLGACWAIRGDWTNWRHIDTRRHSTEESRS